MIYSIKHCKVCAIAWTRGSGDHRHSGKGFVGTSLNQLSNSKRKTQKKINKIFEKKQEKQQLFHYSNPLIFGVYYDRKGEENDSDVRFFLKKVLHLGVKKF